MNENNVCAENPHTVLQAGGRGFDFQWFYWKFFS